MANAYEGWAIVELMGHRRLGGYVQEASMYGATMLRIDVPAPPDGATKDATQFYGGSAIFSVTPTSEETARRVAAIGQPAPVQHWELPQLPARHVEAERDDDSDLDGDREDDDEEPGI